MALLNNGHVYTTYNAQPSPDGTYEQFPVEHTITLAASGVYWVVVLALLIGVAFVAFRRRDVN